MPGTIIFKPAQANLLHDNDFFTKMDTYCTVLHGPQEISGKVCKSGGKQPKWTDNIIIKRAYEPSCLLKIMSKEWLQNDSLVGAVEINLQEIESKGKMSRWYQLSKDGQPAGEIFIESMFAPDSSGTYKQTPYQQSYTQATSPYKDHGRHLYPEDLYSPAKQESYEHRRISQMPLSQIPGLEYTHQITFPHISHHLTPQEYQKLHSRQDERYHPTTKVVRDQAAPPSWAGYELYAVHQSPEKFQENSIGSTAGDTPENVKEVVPESPKVMSYYPMLGGVRYAPSRGGIGYKPIYDKLGNSPIPEKQKSMMEKFDAVADENNGNVGNVNTLETTAV